MVTDLQPKHLRNPGGFSKLSTPDYYMTAIFT